MGCEIASVRTTLDKLKSAWAHHCCHHYHVHCHYYLWLCASVALVEFTFCGCENIESLGTRWRHWVPRAVIFNQILFLRPSRGFQRNEVLSKLCTTWLANVQSSLHGLPEADICYCSLTPMTYEHSCMQAALASKSLLHLVQLRGLQVACLVEWVHRLLANLLW